MSPSLNKQVAEAIKVTLSNVISSRTVIVSAAAIPDSPLEEGGIIISYLGNPNSLNIIVDGYLKGSSNCVQIVHCLIEIMRSEYFMNKVNEAIKYGLVKSFSPKQYDKETNSFSLHFEINETSLKMDEDYIDKLIDKINSLPYVSNK